MTLAELSKTSSSSRRKARRSWAAVGLTAAALVSSGCGGASTPATTTVTQVTTVETTVAQSATEPAPSSPSSSDASTAKTPNSTTTKLEKTTTVTVPDGVGKDYQSAQDLWRGTGLVVGVAKDATGANRLAFLDSNWLVVSQDLAAGTKVPVDTIITATIKKFTDE